MSTSDLKLSRECVPVIGTSFAGERERQPSVAIVEAVAAAEGVTPEELPSLYQEIDLNAIDQLLAGHGASSTQHILLRISVAGWIVFVCNTGEIRVCDPDKPTDSAPVFEKPIAD